MINDDFLVSETVFNLSSTVIIDLLRLKCKDYYWLFVRSTPQEIKAASKWQQDLSLNDFSLKAYFKQLMKICKENKIKEFYFKLLHGIVVSKKELCYFGVQKDPNCNYCGQVDFIKHTFIECHHTKAFFQSVLANFNEEHSTTFTSCDIEMVFVKLY